MSHQFKVGDLVIRHPDFRAGWPEFFSRGDQPFTIVNVEPVGGGLTLAELGDKGAFWSSRFLPYQPASGNLEDYL